MILETMLPLCCQYIRAHWACAAMILNYMYVENALLRVHVLYNLQIMR